MENTLYYGDNLDILRRYAKDETVDLVYLAPPFNSNATTYNVIFAEHNGSRTALQILAFEDIWTWSQEGEAVFAELVMAAHNTARDLEARPAAVMEQVQHPGLPGNANNNKGDRTHGLRIQKEN